MVISNSERQWLRSALRDFYIEGIDEILKVN